MRVPVTAVFPIGELDMDPLLPTLSIVDTSVPQDRQQCFLKPSKDAKTLASRNRCFERNTSQDKKTACEEAKNRCQHITCAPSEVQYLGQLILNFGKYNGQSFKWLVENDVGYIKYVLDLHIKERRHQGRKEGPGEYIKDLLLQYVQLFPQVSCHLEVNVDRAIYGQGRFRSFTFLEMWQWYSLHKTLQADPQAGSAQEKKMAQEAFCSVRQWLTMKEEDISVKTLKRFQQYILNKEKTLEDRPLSAAAASSSSSGSRGDGGWADDALLVEALSAFEAQAVEDKGSLPKKPLSFPERQGAGEAKRRKRSCEDLSQKPHSDSPLSAAPASTSLLEAPASASLVPGQSSSSAPASASSVPGQSSSSAPASASSFPASASSSGPVSASSVPALASSSAPASASSVSALASSSAPASASSVPALASSSAPASASSVPASASSSAPASASSVPASASSSAPASASVSASDVQPRRSSGGSTHSDPAHSEVLFEGWHKMWESGLHGLPSADILWLKEDAERGLFQRAMSYKDKHGNRKWRKVLKDDRMWFHPPEFPGVVEGKVPSADSFFHSSVFFWRPVGVWRYSLRCPRSDCPARTNQKAFLYRCGYSSTVRQICHMSGWYSMLTEVLACNACRKAAKESEEHTIGRFLSWDQCILNQLSPAHRAVFPAVLTLRRGVDKQVIRLMRDRTEGNTMVKVWRQVQESHCEDYLQRKDLYTTLLSQYNKPGKITRSLCQQFQRPPARREPPSARLMRKAFLISEADNIEDYRTQIMSTFGQVLKYDSTKKICKKLSGDGKGTAEWCTNVANEQGQILISVLTCEESLEKMRPMAEGLMERYRRADEAPPELMYVDRGCCRVHAVSSVEQLFSDWTDRGMLVRLDIFHWIHRFDAALRTDHHPKYALFKSALSAAVFAYNKDDMALLVQAIRAGHPTNYASLTDSQIIELRVSKYDLSHYVRRITVGAQETCARVQCAIDLLKGAAGMDENQVHLFKDSAAIDHVWENQQKHLECIQDPPGRNMYTITKYVTRNGVRLARYSTVRGSNSLEGFHSFLPDMIPGPHCAAVPFQVYLLAGIARWNSNRESASVQGRKGRKHMVYMSPLVHRLNQRCQELFGEVEEANYRPPVPAGDERIGLEYLFSQSSEPFSAPDHYAQTRETLQADEDEDEDVPAGVAEEEEELQEEDDDVGYSSDRERDSLTPLRKRLCLTDQAVAAEFDPCVEDVCGPNHLPGYQHVEDLCKVLVEIALEEGKLALNESTRQKVISAWNKLDLHDRSIQQFDSLYSARWGNALFGRTSGDPTEASLVQKLKFSKRYSAAHLVDSRKNRLMYCLVKQLWLHPGVGGKAKGSPLKQQITKLYQRVQQRVTVDDDQLSKLGIPILKINSKCVSEFIRRQEALSATNVTDQGLSVLRRHQSVSSTSQPPAEELPEERPHTSRPAVQYPITTSLAGTRKLKQRLPQILPVPPSALAQPVPAPAHSMPAGLRHTHTPLTAPPAVSLPQASTPLLLPSRSTVYKRKKAELSGSGHPTSVKVYICALCGQPTQGHKKYRKKSYCESSKASTSTNLAGQTFDCFEDFKRAVDVLLGSQSQASESV